MKNRYSRTPNSKISNYTLHQDQRYNNFKKSYGLRQKECEYSRDLFDRSYERALDNAIFGLDSTYLTLTTPKSSPKPAPKPTHRNNSIFSNNLSPTPQNTSESPKVSLYSNYSKYTNIPSSSDYQRRYFKLQKYQSHDFTLQSGSPRFGFTNYFSRSKKEVNSSSQDKDLQKEQNIENQEDDQHKQPSKSTKVSNINETSNTEESSIKPLNGPTSQNQPSKIETTEFDASNSRSPSNAVSKSRSSSSKSNSASRSTKYKKENENNQSGSPSGSGIGAHLYSFENKSQSSKTKGKNNIDISIDFEANENNKSISSNEMMEELRASELESTPQGSFCEEEEEEVEINSNDIINIDNDANIEEEEEEEINQVDIQIDNDENEHEETENENEENENEHEETENEHIENENEHIENEHSNENSNKSHRSISIEDEIEFNKHLNTVAQNLQSISSNIRTGSSSNPHSEMMNTNDEVDIMTTPNRAESAKFKSQSLSQQTKEISIAHSASSDFSPVVFGKSQSEISTDDSDALSNDGIPKPKIDSPKVKNQKGKKI